MKRYWLGLLVLSAGATLARADETPSEPMEPKSASIREQLLVKEALQAERFRQFELLLLRLTDRLANSDKPEERRRAVLLQKALANINEVALKTRFDRLVALLKESRFDNVADAKEALAQGEQLSQDLADLVEMLLRDTDLDARRQKIKRLGELIKMLNGAIRSQKLVRAYVEMGKMEPAELVKAQDRSSDTADNLDKTLARQNKLGLSKLPKQELVALAVADERAASQQLQAAKLDAATEKQGGATAKLTTFRDALEELLRQLREDELKALLENLQSRFQTMLRIQTAVRSESAALARQVGGRDDGAPTREDAQRALVIADRQGLVVREARRAVALLADEGSALAVAEVLSQVGDDAEAVQRRFIKTDFDPLTQSIQDDVVDTLKEVVDAFEKERKKEKKQTKKEPRLVERVTELRIILSMQVRVHNRTNVYAARYKGDEPTDAAVRDEVRNLAARQEAITRVTQGRNQIDIEEKETTPEKPKREEKAVCPGPKPAPF